MSPASPNPDESIVCERAAVFHCACGEALKLSSDAFLDHALCDWPEGGLKKGEPDGDR